MLQESKAFSSLSVNDIEAAKEFYGKTLGLSFEEKHGALMVAAKGCDFMIYSKANHEPAEYTALNFRVDDVDAAVHALIAKGVTFEQYNMGKMKTDEKGIVRNDIGTIAWMKDPAGNIIAILSGM